MSCSPNYLTTIQAPLFRVIGNTGPEVINYHQVSTVYILDGLFNIAELKVGTHIPHPFIQF